MPSGSMWSLEMPNSEDVSCMGMVRKLLNSLNIRVKKVWPNDITSVELWYGIGDM
jgi:hypothetical protein